VGSTQYEQHNPRVTASISPSTTCGCRIFVDQAARDILSATLTPSTAGARALRPRGRRPARAPAWRCAAVAAPEQPGQQPDVANAILNASGMNDRVQQQTLHVDENKILRFWLSAMVKAYPPTGPLPASVKGERGAQSADTVRSRSPGGWYHRGANRRPGGFCHSISTVARPFSPCL